MLRWWGDKQTIELLCRFTLDGEYEQTPFTETMIDHLDIESRIIVAECGEARLQVRRFGLPPLIGDQQWRVEASSYNYFTKARRTRKKFSFAKKFSKKI